MANGLVSLTAGAKGSFSSLSNTTTSPLLPAVNSFRTANNPSPTGIPKAYLNWLVRDDQFNYDGVNSGAIPVGAVDVLALLSRTQIPVKKNGYLYIWVSNESQSFNVFFDNLNVVTYSGPLLEETHYYPFGLTMAGISDKALKWQYSENKNRYNGKELQNQEFSDGTGLEEYDYGARLQDPQLGVWHSIDPLCDMSRRWSPYNYAYDNAIRFVDPDGMWNLAANGGLSTSDPTEIKELFAQLELQESKKSDAVKKDNSQNNTEPDPKSVGGKDENNSSKDDGGVKVKDPKPKGSFASRTMKNALVLGVGIEVVGGGPLDPFADAGAGVVIVGGAVIAVVALAGDAIYEGFKWLFSSSASAYGGRLAQDIISKDRKGSINQEFPDQYRNSTLDQIEKAAKAGTEGAKKALKLLKDGRFKK